MNLFSFLSLNFFLLFSLLFFVFWPCHAARGIVVPCPGTEPWVTAVKALNSNHWTPGNSLMLTFFIGQ